MPNIPIIYESPTKLDCLFIKKYLKQDVPVWVVEPFHTFHHRKGIRFYPLPLPDLVDNLVKKGKINLLKVDQLNAREIYQLAADKAVKTVESVYPEYKKDNKDLFENVCKVLKTTKAENIFKKNLCDRLAEFYSVNILLSRIEKLFTNSPILVYPDTNLRNYHYLKTLLSKSKQDFFEHPNIRFPLLMYITAFFKDFKAYIISVSRLSAQTITSGLLGGFWNDNQKDKKSYLYGITVVSPSRQLAGDQRGPDFIIDNNKIRAEDVVYLSIADLTGDQKRRLTNLPCTVYYPPKAGQCFSHFTKWAKLFWLALKKNFLCNKSEEIKTACIAFFNYFKWLKVLEDITFRHFITHCDFGLGHIARNLALNQAGIETWYFTDSMNHGCNCKGINGKNGKTGIRHPFWTYMYYDHLVTWDELLEQYFKDHPDSFKNTHVVGCLWSGHIKDNSKVARKLLGLPYSKFQDGFILAAFDTTYSRNGFTSYDEGFAFAEHLLQLAIDFSDIYIFFKEKKQRDVHYILDPVLGPMLLDLYNKIDNHSRITTLSNQEDASKLISVSDMVVSFPFTSITFETLSANKPAVWHDPMGYYSDTPYAKVGGIITHSYKDLKKKVMEIKSASLETYRNPLHISSPLMDPYRDGKAIDRFRNLLVTGRLRG